jgi:FkbM family methyltransferase
MTRCKRAIHSLFKTFGYRVVRIEEDAGVGPRASERLGPLLAALKRLGFSPLHIVDVGANHGFWTREAIAFFPDAHYTLVEPQDELKRDIQDLVARGSKIVWVNAAAGDRAGVLPFTIAKRDDSSTLSLSEEEAIDAGLRRVPVEVKTLNEIVRASGLRCPEMVKIDAEGFDLKVLAGASELFGQTEVFLVEAAVCSEYENSAARVVHFMSGAGYRMLDVTSLNRSPRHNVLWLCELAFIKDGSRLLDGVKSYE